MERKERACKECQSEEVEDICATGCYIVAAGCPWWKKLAIVMVLKYRVLTSRLLLFYPWHALIVFF